MLLRIEPTGNLGFNAATICVTSFSDPASRIMSAMTSIPPSTSAEEAITRTMEMILSLAVSGCTGSSIFGASCSLILVLALDGCRFREWTGTRGSGRETGAQETGVKETFVAAFKLLPPLDEKEK